MKLSIITINYNNSAGLERTLNSVGIQTCKGFEHIIVDGASTDSSVDVIKEYAANKANCVWVSESDTGIYNAMNKGIAMAQGEYIQILNSGDSLVGNDVVERMLANLDANGNPSILYGNMIKSFPDGSIKRDRCFAGQKITFMGFYIGTLNHSPAYIKRSLFDKYGKYDENYRIVSDWTWYMDAIIFGGENPVYADIDVTLFDMTGISETNTELTRNERRDFLEKRINHSILEDYDDWTFNITQIKRLKRHKWAYKMFWFMERCLFKIEKWTNKEQRFE